MSNLRYIACLLAFILFMYPTPGKAAQAGLYAANDLLLFFQNPAGTTGTDKVVYFNLGSTFNLFRDAATPGSAAFGSTIPLGNINTILTSTYGADWTGLSSSIFLAATGQNGSTSATSTGTSNGDFARTVYITKARTSLGSVGQANSSSPLYTPSQTAVAGQINGANNINDMTQPGAVLADGTATTGNTLLDDYNPFFNGNPATAYGAINGGLMGSVTNSSFTFGSISRVVSALDLYRVAKTSGTGTTSASIWHNANNIAATFSNDFGVAGGGSAAAYYLGTITLSSDGSVNFVARQPDPAITLAGDDLTGMTTTQGAASTHRNLTITASNLGTSNLSIALPPGFEVSTNGGASYSTTGTIAPTSGAVNATVRVRIAATATQGSLGGDVSVSAGSKSETKPISGTVGAPAPSVAISGTFSGFTTTAGTPSAVQTFSVSGSNLTGNLSVTAPSGFELRRTGSGSYGSSTTISPVSGTVAATSMEIRIAAATPTGPLTGGVITVASTGATPETLSVSGTVNASPSLTVSPASLSGFSATQGTASAAQNFTVSGDNLTGNVTVTAPSGFEVSNGGGIYAGSLTLTRSGGTLASSTISVRLTAANVGSPSGNITVSSGGASSKTVGVSGTVVPPPVITVTGTLAAFTATQGTASAAQTFTVSGANLIGNVTVTAPAGFEVSTDGNNYGNSRALAPVGGAVDSQTVYARVAATASNGAVSGNITVSSAGVTTRTLPVSGTVGLPPALSVLSSMVAFTATQGAVSAVQTFTLSGANLTGNVTVQAPANFEVSVDGTNFFGSRALVPSSGSLGATTVSVRIKATAPVGPVSGNITVSSTGATSQTVSLSGTVVPPPSITTTGTLAAFSTTAGTASAPQTFTVSGASLTGDVTVTAPSGFEVSSGGGSYAGGLTLTPSAGTLASTAITVRLSAAAGVGSPSGNITLSSSGASSKTVAVSGTVVPPPSITVTGTLAAFTATQGTASTVQTFSVSGANLTGNITVEAPANFEVSSDGVNFSTSRTLAQSGGTVASTTISLRIAASAPNGPVGGNVLVSSAGATQRTVPAAGVVGSQPAVTAVSNFATFTATQGTVSAAQTFTVSGANLTGNVTVQAPANFEVSVDGTSFFGSRALVPSSGSLGATTVSVRIKATAPVGPVSGNIIVSSTGATSQTVAVSGTVVPPPSITTAGTLAAFSTTAGTASAPQTFTVSGASLTGDVTVTAPSGFEVSSGGGSYAGSLTLTPSAGTLASTAIAVRLSAAAGVGSPSGNIALSSSGASSKTVAVSGTVVPPPSITVTGTLAAFTATQGTASTVQTFSVSGANLTGNITVEAPANFEVSRGGGTFATSVSLAPAGGAVSATISVRVAASAPLGGLLGAINIGSPGASVAVLPVSGTVGLPPTLSVSSSMVAFTTTQGTVSAAQTFTVSGANLTGNVTITAPDNFEVSTDGSNFFVSRALTPSGGSVASTMIYVRLADTAPVGPVSGNITVSSTGAASQTVSLSGIVVPPPSITTTGTLAAFSTTAGTASVPQTFTVSGANLLGNVGIAAPSGFEVSSDGTSYVGSLTLTQSGGTLASTTISVRIAASAVAGSPSGNITVSSGGASSKTVGVSGTVVPPPSLSTSGTLTSFTTTEGTPSSVQTFTVSGSKLTGDVTVTAPSGFEVSTNGTSFSPILALTPTTGAVSASISVRVAAAAPSGSLSGNISVSTAGVAPQMVAVNATVTASPRMHVEGSFFAFSAISGTASAEQTLQLSGANLTGNVTIMVPDRYEVSRGGGQPYTSSSLIITPVSGRIVNQSIFVRLAAAPVGNYSGDLGFSTSGASAIKVAVSGTVVPPPTVNGSASFVTFSSTLGSASASQAFSVSGANLNAPVTVTAPTGYEVSIDDATFASAQTINPLNGAVASQLYLRIAATTGVGSPAGAVRISSTGATERSLPVTGKVVPPPLLTLSGTLPGLTTRLGTASTGRTFTVSGSDLTGNVTVAAPVGFEVTGQRQPYARTIVLTPSQGSVDVQVTVRIRRKAALGDLSGSITVTSPGAAAKQIAVQGKVSAVPNLLLRGSLKAFNTTRGRPSASQSFVVSGSALNSVVSVTAPSGFQVSANGRNFFSRVQLTPEGSALTNQRVWIRVAPSSSARPLGGNVTASSSGAKTKIIRVSGRIR